MKFQRNGALTIGTLDGANVEIREQVGDENFFMFGLSTEQVYALKARGYRPMDWYEKNAELRAVLDLIRNGFFSRGDAELFRPLVDGLLYQDPYLLLADYESYVDCQDEVSEVFRDSERWTRMAILNSARSGTFSSDRSIRDYSRNIWHAKAVPVELLSPDEIKAGLLQ